MLMMIECGFSLICCCFYCFFFLDDFKFYVNDGLEDVSIFVENYFGVGELDCVDNCRC